MSRGVKAIFKVLVGTVVLMVVAAATVEFINLAVQSTQVQQITRLACKKSLVLFSQETYKKRDESGYIGGSVNMSDIENCDGGMYTSGKFYNSTDVDQIYKYLYSSSYKSDFKNWVNTVGSIGNWTNINLMNRYLNGSPNPFTITTMPVVSQYQSVYGEHSTAYGEYTKAVDEYTKYATAKNFVGAYVTPLNFGVPYLDEETVQKIFQWNLTQLMSNCNSKTIVCEDGSTEYYVLTHGFRVYANKAKITSIDYKIYDLSNSSDRADFIRATNINPDNLGFSADIEYMGTGSDERQRVCVAGVEYSVPISYEGITPLKNIFNYVWNTEVSGLKGNSSNKQARTYEYEVNEMTGGGLNGDTGLSDVLPVPGKLNYYLVR